MTAVAATSYSVTFDRICKNLHTLKIYVYTVSVVLLVTSATGN